MTSLRVHTLGFVAFALAVALPQAPARAQSETPETLIERGLELRRERRDEEALELFRRSHDARPTPRSVAQIGLAEQAIGRMVEAHGHLEEALAARGDEWVERNRTTLEEARERVRSSLGRLEVSGGVPGAEVRVEGAVRGTLPLDEPLWVPAGSLRVDIDAAGHHGFSRTIQVSAGGLARARVDLVALEAGDVAPDTPGRLPGPSGGPSGGDDQALTIAGLVVLAVGVVGLGVGAGTHVLREESATVFNGDGCIRPNERRSDVCSDELAALRGAELGMGVGYAVGGAAAIAGAVMLALGASSAPASERAFGCGAGPGDVGVSCGARF